MAFIVSATSTVKSALYHTETQVCSSVTTRDFVIKNPSPSNPGIPDGATGVSIPPPFSWLAADGATAYDLYLWKDGEAKPATPTITDITGVTAEISYPLSPLTAYLWQIVARTPSGQMAGPEWNFTTGTILTGDLNKDLKVDLQDALLALQVLGGLNPTGIRTDYIASGVAVQDDGKIGLAEVIYILQKVAGAR